MVDFIAIQGAQADLPIGKPLYQRRRNLAIWFISAVAARGCGKDGRSKQEEEGLDYFSFHGIHFS